MIFVRIMEVMIGAWAYQEVKLTVLTYRDVYKLRELNNGNQNSDRRDV